MSVVDVDGVSFSYDDDVVLEDVSLEVDDGDFLAIIGPNGGGKSTLLKLMLGLLEPDKGSVRVFGEDPSDSLNLVGYVPQNTNVNVDFPITVLEVVLMGHTAGKHKLLGYSDEEKECAMSSLEQVGMQDYAARKIGELSGGQRQRVMIARALCTEPKVLLLDEPTASIDIKGQKEIYQLLKKLNEDMTIIVVSHDISVILEYANKAAHINKQLSYHDISNKKEVYHTHGEDGHICEVDLLEMLSSHDCKECDMETES